MTTPAMIAVDWGSSAFRAFLLAQDGTIVSRINTDDGILQLPKKPFEETLYNTCGHWMKEYGDLPVILGGMIGSRNGWIETKYTACPATIDSIRANLVSVPKQKSMTRIVPGVCGNNLFGDPDVMRGEETQVFGALNALNIHSALICLPGTHSKWCVVQDGSIQSFTTFITGEMFSLIRKHSSIGSLVADQEHDQASFQAGVLAGRSNANLLNKLFSIRAGTLLDTLPYQSRASYLSGLIIGCEIKSVSDATALVDSVIVVGSEQLSQRYVSALNEYNVSATIVGADRAFVSGIAMLAETA